MRIVEQFKTFDTQETEDNLETFSPIERVKTMATSEIISCNCKICSSVCCISSNEWIEVSSSYSTYVNVAYFSHPGLELVEPKRPGSKNSELEGCSVQPLRCTKCKTGMGVKCVDGPKEKKDTV